MQFILKMVEVKKKEYMRTEVVDPLRKRENFAVSLRLKKRKTILESKRKRLPTSLRVKTTKDFEAVPELILDKSQFCSDQQMASAEETKLTSKITQEV